LTNGVFERKGFPKLTNGVKRLVVIGFILFHVVALIITAAKITPLIPRNQVTRPYIHLVTLYSKLTLNNQRFAFFAPYIPTWPTVTIQCNDSAGRVFQYKFPIPNREVEVRYNKMVRNYSKPKVRELLFRSWANYIKRQHPSLKKIDIQLWVNDSPTMENYRKGARKSRNLLHAASYSY
jgi:hypothetical protein